MVKGLARLDAVCATACAVMACEAKCVDASPCRGEGRLLPDDARIMPAVPPAAGRRRAGDATPAERSNAGRLLRHSRCVCAPSALRTFDPPPCSPSTKLISQGARPGAGPAAPRGDGRARLGRAPDEAASRPPIRSGRRLGVFLPRGTVLRGGDVLVAEDGSLVAVRAAPQPVLVVRRCPRARHAVRPAARGLSPRQPPRGARTAAPTT